MATAQAHNGYVEQDSKSSKTRATMPDDGWQALRLYAVSTLVCDVRTYVPRASAGLGSAGWTDRARG